MCNACVYPEHSGIKVMCIESIIMQEVVLETVFEEEKSKFTMKQVFSYK